MAETVANCWFDRLSHLPTTKNSTKELSKCEEKHITDWATLKLVVREELGNYIYKKTKREPMLIPIIMEV